MDGNQGKVRLITSNAGWIEGEAVRQLEAAAALRGIEAAVGMPDLHPGRGYPIGAAFISRGVVHPHLVGSDIGCGMGVWQTNIAVRRLRLERSARRLVGLDDPWDGDRESRMVEASLPASLADPALGTIGSGNHFAELQRVDTIDDTEAFSDLNLDQDRAVLLVHSGSRGLGQSILSAHADKHGGDGLETNTPAFHEYRQSHDAAVIWARVNRDVIADRFLGCLAATAEKRLDLCHNSVTPADSGEADLWVHRKGAAPSGQGPVVIAGSRGAVTYLIEPRAGDGASACSVAHGAGRKWTRSDAKARLAKRFRPDDLRRTALGGRVICSSRDLLYEEAPEAYKNVEAVVAALVEAGLARVVATFRPVITYKTRRP